MALNARSRRVYIAPETTFSTDPDSDGSDYLYVPAIEVGDIEDGLELLETNYQAGAPWDTAPIPGRDGGSISIKVPLIGLSTAAGDGSTADSTGDWLSALLLGIFGGKAVTAGEGVGSGSTTSNLVLDTDVYSVSQLIPVYDATILTTAPRTQWSAITADASNGQYTMAPVYATAPTTNGVAYGVERFTYSTSTARTFSIHTIIDTTQRTLTGCRITAASIVAELGQIATLNLTFAADTCTYNNTKASIPAVSRISNTPITMLKSSVWWAGSSVDTSRIEINFQPEIAEIDSTAGTNGRAGTQLTKLAPTVSFEPLFADANLTAKRAGTEGTLMVQLGAGVLASSKLNTLGFYMDAATIMEANPKADGKNLYRNGITARVANPFSTTANIAQLCRA